MLMSVRQLVALVIGTEETSANGSASLFMHTLLRPSTLLGSSLITHALAPNSAYYIECRVIPTSTFHQRPSNIMQICANRIAFEPSTCTKACRRCFII